MATENEPKQWNFKNIDPKLDKDLKQFCFDNKLSQKQVVSNAVEDFLNRTKGGKAKK